VFAIPLVSSSTEVTCGTTRRIATSSGAGNVEPVVVGGAPWLSLQTGVCSDLDKSRRQPACPSAASGSGRMRRAHSTPATSSAMPASVSGVGSAPRSMKA
jgi:hypothetical protein